MFRNSKGSATAAADRAAALVETVRPIVTKAMHDPELHEALRNAFQTGRAVQGEISGKPPKKAAKNITSEMMNQVMPILNERSTWPLYMPVSLSLMTVANQPQIITSTIATPSQATQPIRPTPFSQDDRPSIMKNRPTAPTMGQ